MNRILTAARLQLVAWRAAQLWPWAILALSWLVNLAIFAALYFQEDPSLPLVSYGAQYELTEQGSTGGLLSIYGVMFFIHMQTMTKGFGFALGMSMSRRSYYLGATLFAVGQAVVYGAVIHLLLMLEDSTGGWGVDMRFFGVPFLRESNPVLQLLVYVVPFLLVAALGMTLGVLLRRWGSNGAMGLSAVLIGLVGVVSLLVTIRGWWREIGHWFTHQSALSLFAGWSALLALVVAVGGYLVVRRTPIA